MFGLWRRSKRTRDDTDVAPLEMPRVAQDERIYAIGDVHGRADLLDRLLDIIARDEAAQMDGRRSQLVLLGDYVDRGEESRAVLERVAALRTQGAICLMGNHEEALLGFINDPERHVSWLSMGGLQTLASYGVRLPLRREPAELRESADALMQSMGTHTDLLKRGLRRYYRSGDVVFVHAGLEPDVALEHQSDETMLWGHNLGPQLEWKPGTLIVHGHFASNAVVETLSHICVDTGAFYSSILTCIRMDSSHSFISSLSVDS